MRAILLVGALLLLAGLVGYWRLCACKRAPEPTGATLTGYAEADWPDAYKMVREKFPDVKQLSTAQLSEWLADKAKVQPVLLDTRAANEYAVSHLPGALHAESEEQAATLLKGKAPDIPVVLYCSIGYRSSALATKLKARGFTNVQNLEGSIFMWANEGRWVERNDIPVKGVHPFDEKWGRLLTRERWAWQ